MVNKKIFAECHIELLLEWMWDKNKTILDPYSIGCYVRKKVWWKCKKCSYEWEASIESRHYGSGCPYCANNVVWTGHNDIVTLYPELLKDWDYEKNTGLNPNKMSKTSPQKVAWKCNVCGYEWNATVGSRAHGGNGCPYCSGKAVWTGHNDLATVNPILAEEWNFEKNDTLLPSMFSVGSAKKVWWRCRKCGYEWQATIGSRSAGNGCPECGKVKCVENRKRASLKDGANTLAVCNPQLANEWNVELNEMSPEEVAPYSHHKVWWKCPTCGYVYRTAVADRSKGKTGCPVCANQKLCIGINDLMTMHPDIAAEWSDKNNVKPDEILAGGHKKYYFICAHCGFEWKAGIRARINGNGCPNCAGSFHTSIPEQVIFRCLKYSFDNVKNSYRPRWLKGKEIDIYMPDLKVGIEYDGAGWHMDVEKDIEKTNILTAHDITLIRIREDKCPLLDDSSIKISAFPKRSNYLNDVIAELYELLQSEFGVQIILSADINSIYEEEMKKHRTKTVDKSLASVFPHILEEWDYQKNKGFEPNKMAPYSNISVWWKCKKCSYEWKASIDRRTRGGACPYCTNEVLWGGHNDLVTLRPDLLDEWDYEANGVKPNEVRPNSHIKVAWKCKTCGYKWSSALYNKATGHGCPECAKIIRAKKCGRRVENLDTGKIYLSAAEAAKDIGTNPSNITRVCRGEGKSAGGFHWRYID